jgi:hypothetical protein
MDTILKEKKYAHLDQRKKPQTVESSVKNPRWVSRHGFLPFIHIEMKTKKRNGKHKLPEYKTRDLYYASHIDSYIYQWYAHILSVEYEKYIDKGCYSDCPIAYRSIEGKCNIDFAKEAFDFIKTQTDAFVFVSDFHKFFDTLDHKILKQNIKKVLNTSELPPDQYAVYKSMTCFRFFDLDDIASFLKRDRRSLQRGKDIPSVLMKSEEMREFKKNYLKNNPNIKIDPNNEKCSTAIGIPQGSSISTIYANVYMIDFDKTLSDFVKQYHGLYRRYSDDIFCVVPYQECNEFCTLFYGLVKDHQLTMSDKKTRRFHVVGGKIKDVILKEGESTSTKKIIEYLGFSYDGRHILLKDATLNRFYQKLNNRLYLIKKLFEQKGKIVGKQRLYKSFSHLGEADRKSLQELRKNRPLSMKHRNFLSYTYKAADIIDEPKIRHQVAKHWKHIQLFLDKLEED